MELASRVEQLENELLEFQESSKELEQALEDELSRLEATNLTLQTKLEQARQDAAARKERERGLEQELKVTREAIHTEKRQYDEKIHNLTQRLVAIEVANESMELNDRMYSSKLQLAQQMNNELLEKLAMAEDEVQRQREIGIQKDLHISNCENTIADLKRQLEGNSNTAEQGEADILVLSMRDVLKSGPKRMPKSESLNRLRELTELSQVAANKATSIRQSIILPEAFQNLNQGRQSPPNSSQAVAVGKMAAISQPAQSTLKAVQSHNEKNVPSVQPYPSRKKSRRILSSLRAFTKAAQQPVK